MAEQSEFALCEYFKVLLLLLLCNGQALCMFTDMGEQSSFALYKYFYCYLMDRLSESLPTWVNKEIFCFINSIVII